MEPTTRRIPTSGFDTFLNEAGPGDGRPVLLLHGSGPGANAMSNWRFLLPFLAGHGWRVLAPDIAGFGESLVADHPVGTPGWLDTWVAQQVALLDALGIEQADVIGNSMGGGLALHLADRHPQRCGRVVLMGAIGAPFVCTEGLAKGWGFYREASEQQLAWLVRRFLYDPTLLGPDVERIAAERFRYVMQPHVRAQFESMFPGDLQAAIDAFVLPDHRLLAMTHPFLVTHAREDFFIPLANSYYLAERLPNAQLHTFHHCGHWVMIEQRHAFNELMQAFLSGALD